MKGASLVVVAALASACTPFYRLDEARSLRAEDSESRAGLRREADARLAAGDGARAASAYETLLELNPRSGADVYLALAQARAMEGQRAEARAAARYALEQATPADGERRELELLLARLYAEDGLFEAALSHLPDATLDAALRVPPLAEELAPMAEAVRLARLGQAERALAAWDDFVARHGVPSHPLLRTWARPVLDVTAPAVAALRRELAAAGREGRAADADVVLAALVRAGEPLDVAAECQRLGGASPAAEAVEAGRAGFDALGRHQLGEALRGWRRAVAASPCWGGAHWNLALLLAQEEQHAAAAEHARVVLALPGDTALAARASAFVGREERLADPSQARALRETEARVEASLLEARQSARTWRGRGTAFLVAAGLVGVAAVTFAGLGSWENGRVRAGGFATASDIQGAIDTGQAWNRNAFALAAAAGVLALVGTPLVLFNLDPASPPPADGGPP